MLYIYCLRLLSIYIMSVYHIYLQPLLEVRDINVQVLAKPNLVSILEFARYTRV